MKNRRRPRISDFRPQVRIGLEWFEPEDYARILEIVNYPASLSRSYERWREIAENQERTLKRSRRGLFVVRVVIKPDKFLAWCAARSVEPSHNIIASFVQEAIGLPV